MNTAVLLIDPKFDHNVGGALRACSVFGTPMLAWTGKRVLSPGDGLPRGYRLPREERMKRYEDVAWFRISDDRPIQQFDAGLTPVCVELVDNAEDLTDFVHPEDALYVFGPEDGSVPKGVKHACHRFVRIPSASCLNLSAAVNVLLYDRMRKAKLAARV